MKLDSVISSLAIDRAAEVELLLCCAHSHTNPVRQGRIQALVNQQLDWDYILERANYHGILPLLDRQLQPIDNLTIPAAVLTELRANAERNFQHNLRLTLELVKIGRLFADQSMPMMSFKGPVLAQLAYGNLGLRQFLDIDILIPEAEVIRANQLLGDRGYQPEFTLTDRQRAILGVRNEQWFWHPEDRICIDLHWSILPKHYSFTPPESLVWSKIDRVNFAQQSIDTLSPEHLLLFLCAHGSKHNWSRLYWICDLAELLRDRAIDWGTIHSLSGQFGTERMLLLGLFLAHQLLDANLPASVLERIAADRAIPILAARIQAGLFQPPVTGGTPLPVPMNQSLYRTTMTSIADRVWFWLDAVFTPTSLEWKTVDLPQSLFLAYYLVRIFRLTLKYLKIKMFL